MEQLDVKIKTTVQLDVQSSEQYKAEKEGIAYI
jgi:hypothetical protein